jgi:hypothetical protein
MKKTALFSTLFLAVFGLTLGITLMTYEPANAIYGCTDVCMFTTQCSMDTGPACESPFPYYVYRVSYCVGGPYNCPYVKEQLGCWNGVPPCRPVM